MMPKFRGLCFFTLFCLPAIFVETGNGQSVPASRANNVTAASKIAKSQNAGAAALPVLCGSKEIKLIIDLNSTSAARQIELCPPANGKSSAAVLSADDFTSRMTKLDLGTTVTFSNLDGSKSGMTFDVPAMTAGKVMSVKVQVTNMWEAGEAEAPLKISGIAAGTLVATKYRLPFAVQVDAPDPSKPEMILQKDENYDVVLKNGDPVTYRVKWDLQVFGKSVSTQNNEVVITPNGSAKFTVQPNCDWYGWGTGLLKDYDQDGKLVVSLRPPGVNNASYWPSKVIPVKIHLRYASESTRAWVVNTLLIAVLFLGAICSFVGSLALPNRLKRSEYEERLDRLGQQIGGISHQVDSRLRVVLRVQRKRLHALLKSRRSISPDLARIFTQVEQGILALEKQVQLTEQIDAVHVRLKLLDRKGAPPSLLDQVRIRYGRQLQSSAGSPRAMWNSAKPKIT